MDPDPAPAAPVTVARFVAIGDSITEGVGDERPSGEPQGWADRLAAAIAARQGHLSYANLAIRGRNTRQIRAEQAEAALALEPDLISAVVGVNDLVASQFDAEAFDAEVDRLFAMLRRDGATVLSSMLPDLVELVPLPSRVRAQIRRRHTALNAVLVARAAEHGVALLPLADMVDAVDRRVWSPDRLHPNTVGHALLAEAMLQLLDGRQIAVSAVAQQGYGATPYARAGVVASATWGGRYLLPRTVRRLRGRSSGDGRAAKMPAYVELGPAVTGTASGAGATTVTLGAGDIRYEVVGDGPPVVFVHPLLTSALHWRKVVPTVAQSGLACYTPTLPLGAHDVPMRRGADLTPPGMAGLLAEFIETLDAGPVTLVGNDSGGALAQMVAATYPELVARLVLTSCDCLEYFFPPLFRYLKWGARVPGFPAAIGQVLRVRALRHTPLTFGWLAKHRIAHEVLDAYARPFLTNPEIRRDVVTFIRGVDSRHTCEAAERLRHFDRPVLLAWAREDRVFPPALAERLAAILPAARLAWIDDSYAFTAEDQPDVLARLIVEFCADDEPL